MARWNIDVPPSEYFGPLPYNPKGVVSGDVHQLIHELTYVKEIAIDTETTGLSKWGAQVLYWSLAWGKRRCTLHASLLPYFRRIFSDPSKIWILANAKFDAHMLMNTGGNYLAGELHCTQVMHSLLFEGQSHRLKDMAQHLLGWRWSDFQDTFGKITKNFSPFELIRKAEAENFPLLVEYAANDAWGTLGCWLNLRERLSEAYTHSLFRNEPPYIDTLWDLFYKVEAPYTKVLWKNERNGILIDQARMASIAPIARKEIEDLERAITRDAQLGRPINPNSTNDLSEYFFDAKKYEPLKMTTGGKSGIRKASVDKGFLEYIAETYSDPVAKMLLEHRNLVKLEGTYIQGLSDLMDPNGRIHTQFNQDIARTGRLSSADPNLQNIPNVDKDKWKLRGAFIAGPGNLFVVADYSQLEMRLLACASLQPEMIQIFFEGKDIHMGNASMMMGTPYDDLVLAKDIDKQVKAGKLPESAMTRYVLECIANRAAAKNIGFGLNYGMGPGKLANDLGVSKAEAIAKIELYKKTYPAVTNFYREAIEETERTGYAFTILGRRRNVPGILSHRNDERAQAERIAVNTQIQGSAADVVKMAQINLDRARLDYYFNCHSLLQVHDELVHECPAEMAPFVKKEIKAWMETPFFRDLAVPLTVDASTGPSWLLAK